MISAALVGAIALCLATYAAAVGRALIEVSRTGLEARLEGQDRGEQGQWLFANLVHVQLMVGLVRAVLQLTVFAAVLVEMVGTGEEARLTYGRLAAAVGVTAAILWLTTSVIGSSLARHAAEALVAGALPLLRGLTFVCLPLTRALGFVDEAVRRLTGANLRERDAALEADLLRSIGDSHREGGLDERSAALLENVVEFSSTDVGEVMTPRTDIDGLEYTDDLAVIRSLIAKLGHSRIPIYEENLDHIVGVLYIKDLVPYLGEDATGFQLRPLLRQPILVPETKPVRELLSDFQRSEVHLAMVIDEYGGTAGLVTIEDVLEEIVGEIHDEHDVDLADEPAVQIIDAVCAEADGRYHIDDLNEELGLALPEDEEFDTVAGFVLATLGRVPEVGESFESHSARFSVLAATSTQIQRIAVEILEPALTNGDRRRKGNNGT